MAKLIQTITRAENQGRVSGISASPSTWTIKISDTNNGAITASGTTFTINYPTVIVSRVNSNSKYTQSAANFSAMLYKPDGNYAGYGGNLRYPSDWQSYKWTSQIDTKGTEVQVYRRKTDWDPSETFNTSTFFSSSNSTTKSVKFRWKFYLLEGGDPTILEEEDQILLAGLYSRAYSSGSYEGIFWTTIPYTTEWDVVITLNAPPTFTSTNVSFNESYHVAGHTTASVTLSSLSAKYGGTIKSAVLKIGDQTASRTTNGTLSIACNKAGTFTPTVTVTDSRNQVTTKSLSSITINSHTAPTFTASQVSFNESYHVAGHTTATVTLSDLSAKQGSTIKSAVLTIGDQTASRTTNGTLSIACNKAGTFTPKVVVTDSWGSTTTKTLNSITINSHTAPTFTASQVYYNVNYVYAGMTTAKVDISSLSAKQGSTVKNTVLTIGSQTASTTTSGNQTLSIALNNVGTFTPKVVLTDSWGSSTTKTLSNITVNQYVKPSVSITPRRIDSSTNALDDEGKSARVDAKFTYTTFSGNNLTAPTVVVKDDAGQTVSGLTVTWYVDAGLTTTITWSSVTSGQTVYAKITNGDGTAFNTLESYTIYVTPQDAFYPGTTINSILASAYYTIDFLAGGHGVAFGKPATREAIDSSMAIYLDTGGDTEKSLNQVVHRKRAGRTYGWACSAVNMYGDATDSGGGLTDLLAVFGAYGPNGDTREYMFVGCNAYNGANLRIYPSGACVVYQDTSTESGGFKHISNGGNYDTGFIAQRSDTSTKVVFGITGTGSNPGVNHGIYSNPLGRWMIFSDGSNNYLYDTKAAAYAAFRTPPSHITLFTGHNYKATSTNWEYINKSFTVPANHAYLVRLGAGWSTGKPIGLGINSSSTLGSNNFPSNGYQENENGIYTTPTFLLPAGTYYVFCKRMSVPTGNNTHWASALDIPI